MKCAYHPETDAVAACVECGRFICPVCSTFLGGKTYCPTCADRVFVKKGKLTAKPVVGGVLGIIAGVAGLIIGISLIVAGFDSGSLYRPVSNVSPDWAEVSWGIGVAILGIVAIVGSSFAIARKRFPLALAGGVCAVLSIGGLLGSLLGIPALILIAMSKSEFSSSKQPEDKP